MDEWMQIYVLVELFDHRVRETHPKSQSRPWKVLQQTCDENSPADFHKLIRMHNVCKTVMPASCESVEKNKSTKIKKGFVTFEIDLLCWINIE